MSRFSQQKVGTKTVNLAGGEAYQESADLELVSILLTSFVQDQFYKSASDSIDRVAELLDSVDPLFAAKAAIFARTEFGMRTITHVLAGELAKKVKNANWTKRFFDKIVYRPDDMIEIMAYYMLKYGKRPIPNSMKRGFTLAFKRFDEYQIAKYAKAGKTLSLIDVANLISGRKTDRLGNAVSRLSRGMIFVPDTWEVRMTKAGQESKTEEEKEAAKATTWKELLVQKKLGYFALLRNLRNIAETVDDETFEMALDYLVNRKAIKNSLVLPFRYETAREGFLSNQIKKHGERLGRIFDALGEALEASCDNVPVLSGETLVALDRSGSMMGRPMDIAKLFAAVLFKSKNNVDVLWFDTDAEYVQLTKRDSIETIINKMPEARGGTDFELVFNAARKAYDRIIILSDMQAWVGWYTTKAAFSEYKIKFGVDPKIYSFDLAGYGTLQFPERNIFALAGFSEKIFDIMGMLEEDPKALINKINAVEV